MHAKPRYIFGGDGTRAGDGAAHLGVDAGEGGERAAAFAPQLGRERLNGQPVPPSRALVCRLALSDCLTAVGVAGYGRDEGVQVGKAA